jgi:hypothetical protein
MSPLIIIPFFHPIFLNQIAQSFKDFIFLKKFTYFQIKNFPGLSRFVKGIVQGEERRVVSGSNR